MAVKTKRQAVRNAVADMALPGVQSIVSKVDQVSGLSGPSMDFTTATNGTEQRQAWARYQQPWSVGSGSPYAMTTGGFVSRDRNMASRIATDFTTSNPTIATIIENQTTANVGTGLVLSAKLDARALGITPQEARELASEIEHRWARWAASPQESDLSGRHNVHQLAGAAYETALRTGEILAVLDVRRVSGALTMTKVSLLDPNQLDASKTRKDGTTSTFQGVCFDANGRVNGYFILPLKVGHYMTAPQSVFVPAFTSWGRQKVIHLFQLRTPGQVRGLSPLTAALTPAMEKNTLGEFTQAAALLGTMYAMTIESELSSSQAINGLRVVDDGLGTDPLLNINAAGSLESRLLYYKDAPIVAAPGVINHLAKGDRLRINRSEAPNGTFEAFDKSLTRTAAKAAGSDYADISGDWSETSFSASRLAMETPHRINLKRRANYTEAFYRAVYAAFLEEQLERGLIALPKNAPPFYAARDVYLQSSWLGSGRVSPDPLKAAQATKLELEMGLTTLGEALAERGKDLETVIAERKEEREMMRAAGLLDTHTAAVNGPNPDPADDNEGDDMPVRRKVNR